MAGAFQRGVGKRLLQSVISKAKRERMNLEHGLCKAHLMNDVDHTFRIIVSDRIDDSNKTMMINDHCTVYPVSINAFACEPDCVIRALRSTGSALTI